MELKKLSIIQLKKLATKPIDCKYLKDTSINEINKLIKQNEIDNEKWLDRIDLNNPKSKFLKYALLYLKLTGKIKKYYVLSHSGYGEVDFGELILALYKISQYHEKSKRGKYARRYRKI